MNDSIKRISLDIHSTGSMETVNVKKGDTARKLIISLVEGGIPYIIGEDCSAIFTGKKPDRKVVFNDCIIKDNTIIYEFTEQTVAVEGRVNCEIKLYGANKKLITSPKFTIIVNNNVYNKGDEIESSDEFNALLDALSKVQDIDKKINRVDLTKDQNLTPEEQAMVRANIGVTTGGSGVSISANIVDNVLQVELSDNLKSFIQDGVLIVE